MSDDDDYYNKVPTRNSDGTPIFCSEHDKARELEVAEFIQDKWKCDMRWWGNLFPIDYYALRDGRMAACIEIKSRTHASSKYPDVYLNARKWLALMLIEVGMGCPAFFVCQFSDRIMWIRAAWIDARRMSIAGRRRRLGPATDIAPMIHIPIDEMRAFT